jgi:hypothetical protein
LVERVRKVFPQAQATRHSTYSGWIPFFIGIISSTARLLYQISRPLQNRGKLGDMY